MFAQLQHRHPHVPAYATNLFAARISLLLGSDLFRQLHNSALIRGRQVLIEAEQMMLHVKALGNSNSEIFRCNKALLLLALGQPEQANKLLTSRRALRLRDRAAAYAAVALARMERAPEAMAVLSQAEQTLGRTDVLKAARIYIESGNPVAATANFSFEEDPLPRVRDALLYLPQLDPMRQAAAVEPSSEPFTALVIKHVRSAAASVTALAPMMKGVEMNSCEDDLSALVRELLVARFQFLGWSVPDQSKRGWTAKGNPGEPDLLLQKDSTILAAIEAVVCELPVSFQNLTNHFQKLLGYAQCRLFFHLTYAYIPDPASILNHLRKMVEHDAPPGFRYITREEIPYTDSRPRGFITRYAVESDELEVVFLVLDMGQHRQKEAAKIAAMKTPRNQRRQKKPARSATKRHPSGRLTPRD